MAKADLLTQADIDLYNAIIAERTAKKPSIKKQLAENKGKSEPMKSKTQQQKEDIYYDIFTGRNKFDVYL